jgi:murein DD-endopeptidase MepM/ murein hydrolase activator NlpD
MKKITLMVIPDGAHSTKQLHIPQWILKVTMFASFGLFGLAGFLTFDYIQLRTMRSAYQRISAENEGLKGEARALMTSLEDVRRSLSRVQDYTTKLTEITNIKVRTVSKETGIGPLSPEEYKIAEEKGVVATGPADHIPLGVDLDKLTFRPVFDRLYGLGLQSNKQVHELQFILSNLSQQKSLLASIPSISPVNGWVTSGFGNRISPFTGQRTPHQGIDVASPIGTPIYAPADGVVIFTGTKAGFGNFIMIAHGYGIVSRYGHNAQNMVQPGQRVSRGEQIATVGMTGRTTGPHLHYEVLVNGRYANPKKFILDLDEDMPLAH